MRVLARGRHLLARRPWLYWLAVAAIAAVGGLAVARATASVVDARRAWGATRQVAVAVADVAPGDPLDVTVHEMPVAMVPVGALDAVEPGARARQRIGAGEIVVAHDIAAPGGPIGLIPAGWRAVAVAETVPTGAAVGDHVVPAASGVVLADDGLVVGTTVGGVLVAVPGDHAAAVAAAAAAGELSLLLIP